MSALSLEADHGVTFENGLEPILPKAYKQDCGRVQHSAACRGRGPITVIREPRSSRVSVSLTEQDRKALEKMAERSDLSLSRIVQEAVREFVKIHANKKVDVLRSSDTVATS